jgi:selenocysteine-specific elongation factor
MALIMGTAGHIDHGKTSLIRAMTGIDCDRLKHEKKRGITIELGFAYLDLPGGERVGVVDVPGHEKFVKNMVAGAAGIDFVLLTVAADEGIMPQTREHLEICSLLNIKDGLVALTKTDLVDQELLELAQEDVSDYLSGTFLEDAPLIPVSAHTGQGLEELGRALQEIVSRVRTHKGGDLFRLPVDRVFTIRGHGTVVTGTLISGQLALGERVTIYPHDVTSKVRGLQVHEESVETAQAGQRTAINLSALEVEDLDRGDVVARPGTLFPRQVWDLELKYLSSAPRPLKHRREVHFHHGSKETLARIYLLDRDEIRPGETGLAQVRFPEPMPGAYGDNFVLRSFSPLRTIAGGKVINPFGRKVRRFSDQLEVLRRLAEEDPETILMTQLELAGPEGASAAHLRVMCNLAVKDLDRKLQELSGKQRIFLFDRDERRYVHMDVVGRLTESLLDYVREYHRKHPLQAGLPRGMLTSDWGRGLAPKLVHFLAERCIRLERLVAEQENVRLPEHSVSLAQDQEQLKQELARSYENAGITPPNLRELLEGLSVSRKDALPVLKLLNDEGRLVKVKEDLYFSASALERIKELVLDYFSRNQELTPTDFKNLTGLTRKFSIPLLEYLDKQKVTVRVGDARQLRRGR